MLDRTPVRTFHTLVRSILITAVLGTLLLCCPSPSTADAVYLKDGFTLHGKVKRENEVMFDPATGMAIPIVSSRGSNFFIVHDGVRWVIFSHRNVRDADPEVNVRSDFIELLNPLPQNRPNTLPKAARLAQITPFSERLERDVVLANELGRYKIRQRLTSLTPYAARLESNIYQWNIFYLTKELGLETVKKLLADHPDLKETNGPDIDKRMKRFRFLLQAGWLLAADEELNQIRKDFPDEKERTERGSTSLRQAQVRSFWEEVETAHRAGRHRFVSEILNRLPISELDQRTAAEANTLKTKYDTGDRQMQDFRRLLGAITDRQVGPPRPVFLEAVSAIQAEVSRDNLDRLEPFLSLAAQHEQERKAGRTPTYSNEAILALAVTGWVLGREAAEPRVEAAEHLWGNRSFALNYLRTHDPAERRRALADYQAQKPLGLDEMTQLIALLPPPEPAEPPAANAVEARVTQVPWTRNRPINYALQLPPEYRPGRSYPLLIVLSNSGENPDAALAHWSPHAARHGYILAAPQWVGVSGGYNYTPEEHSAVLETILDLRRRYGIDSDRVFLTGYGDGATMAFDVALSHPDYFAGVVPVNGQPRWSASSWYWRNAQYLPFYIVAGELAGNTCTLNRQVFENWMSRGYQALMTIYRGRPMEFYQAELPFIFDWMNRKRRATGFPELGRGANMGSQGEEIQTMRPTDNHFYWVSAETINDKYLNPLVGQKAGSPAAFTAQVRNTNEIIIHSRGIKHLRVWLGRTWNEQSGSRPMIDFEKPVRVTANNRLQVRDRLIKPSLETMLEDLYQRGDRQRLFMAYIDLANLQ